ncbi:MAG: TetR/AcrR family transcriptional regulator [Pseudomonadota bacterium]
MSKANTVRWEEKREAILDAATRVLNRTGLSGFRLAEVASDIGLKRPSIVYYFANTEDLAEVLYERALDQIERRVVLAGEQGDPRARLNKLLTLELEHHAAERAGQAIRRPQLGEIRALSSEKRRKLGKRYHKILSKVSTMLGVDDAGPRLIGRLGPAHIVMETVFWLPAWLDEYEPWAFSHVRDVLVETLADGLLVDRKPGGLQGLLEQPRVKRDSIDQDDYLRSASRLICDMGFRGTAIDRISAELGVTKGSFYHHITQKHELIEACFAHSQRRLSEIQRRASERQMAHEDRINSVISSIIAIQLEGRFPLLRTSALPALSAEVRAKIIAQSKRNFRWFASEISAAVASGTMRSRDPYIGAQILGVTINAVYDLSRLYGDGIGPQDVKAYRSLLMQGILTPSA